MPSLPTPGTDANNWAADLDAWLLVTHNYSYVGSRNEFADMTEENIDLASIVDINQLKAMAYDRMAGMEQLQGELRMINERIAQVQNIPVADEAE